MLTSPTSSAWTSSTVSSRRLEVDGMLEKALPLEIFDIDGNSVTFSSLLDELNATDEGCELKHRSERVVVVFVRHFFCCSCQQYAAQLSTVPRNALDVARVKVVLIGCGSWEPIKHYIETTDTPPWIRVYADPSRALFRALDITTENYAVTPPGVKRKTYLKDNFWSNVLNAIIRGPVFNPGMYDKWGPIAQLGGEFVFAPGPTCTFRSFMRHTEDHTEIADLMKEAGVDYQPLFPDYTKKP